MGGFPEPKEGSVFYKDERVYACLAFHPIVDGHTIVAVKRNDVDDLGQLSPEEQFHLLQIVFEVVRPALLVCYKTDKVYVAYLDETGHPHFHLFPRKKGEEEGFGLMVKRHGELTDFSMVTQLRSLAAKAVR